MRLPRLAYTVTCHRGNGESYEDSSATVIEDLYDYLADLCGNVQTAYAFDDALDRMYVPSLLAEPGDYHIWSITCVELLPIVPADPKPKLRFGFC